MRIAPDDNAPARRINRHPCFCFCIFFLSLLAGEGFSATCSARRVGNQNRRAFFFPLSLTAVWGRGSYPGLAVAIRHKQNTSKLSYDIYPCRLVHTSASTHLPCSSSVICLEIPLFFSPERAYVQWEKSKKSAVARNMCTKKTIRGLLLVHSGAF